MAERPRRLDRIFDSYASVLWFVTFNTHGRAHLLATPVVHDTFLGFCHEGRKHDVHVGRYVLMPDHAHLFVAGSQSFELAKWVRALKLVVAKAIPHSGQRWQDGFFDHLVRNQESYAQKWDYVYRNPVRAGLVASPEEWPYQGEVNRLDFH